jgi:hypothetical protein
LIETVFDVAGNEESSILIGFARNGELMPTADVDVVDKLLFVFFCAKVAAVSRSLPPPKEFCERERKNQ